MDVVVFLRSDAVPATLAHNEGEAAWEAAENASCEHCYAARANDRSLDNLV